MMKRFFADPSVSGDEMARLLAVYSCRLETKPMRLTNFLTNFYQIFKYIFF